MGTLVGSTINISPNSLSTAKGVYQFTGDVVYNPTTSKFLVAWEDYPGPDTMVRQFNVDGSAAGSAINVSAGPGSGGQGAPALAYDWQDNTYFVVFTGDNPLVSGSYGVYGYVLNGTTAAIASNMVVLSAGFNIEPSVAYLPERGGFLPAWTAVVGSSRTSNARFVPGT